MTTENEFQVIWLSPAEVNPAKYNPREISAEALNGLKASILRFGMPDPLIVNQRTNVLVSGHQRLKAAMELGWEKVPVVLVDLTELEEKALNVTLNNQKIMGYFTDGLQELLAEIRSDLPVDFEELKLDSLVIQDSWNEGSDEVNAVDENLEGIEAEIKVRCPQEIKSEVTRVLQLALEQSHLEGAKIV